MATVKWQRLAIVLWVISRAGCGAETIRWFSNPGAVNRTSAGVTMDAGFTFELGVFANSFVPTAGNTAQWAANWAPAQRVPYNSADQRYDGQFTVQSNAAPFTAGKAAYVWGFRGGTASSEWILFRNPGWNWPAPNPLNPFGIDWDAAAATPVVGTINAGGSPFLMNSAAVGAVSPPTTWEQWRDENLAGVALNGPNDDPDHDGTSNLLEFVFGTSPVLADAPPPVSLETVTQDSQRYLQASIPRRADRPVALVVEISSDLTTWNAAGTAVISDTAAALVVRDLTPLGPATPRRFLRCGAGL